MLLEKIYIVLFSPFTKHSFLHFTFIVPHVSTSDNKMQHGVHSPSSKSVEGNIGVGGSGVHSPSSKSTKTIIVEGNIGVGKSTFLKYMAQFGNVEVVPEPIEKWIDLNEHNLLEYMYKDPEKWSYTFQNYALLTQLENHLRACEKDVKIMERSIYSTRYCFGRALLYDKKIDRVSFQVFSKWFEYAKKRIENQVDLIIYLRASPEIVYDRIVKRNRAEEKGIPFQYVSRLHEFHEFWLYNNKRNKINNESLPVTDNGIPIFVLDASLPTQAMHTEYEKLQKFLLESPQFNINLQ